MKNITFSLEDQLLSRAREKARQEHRSLNELFRLWVETWLQQEKKTREYDLFMKEIGSACDAGRHFSREELNER